MSSASKHSHHFSPDVSKEFSENVRRAMEALEKIELSYKVRFEDVFDGHAVIRDEYVGAMCPDGSIEYRESAMYTIRGKIRIEPWWM